MSGIIIDGTSNPCGLDANSYQNIYTTRTRGNILNSAQFASAILNTGITNIITQTGKYDRTDGQQVGTWGVQHNGIINTISSSFNPSTTSQFAGGETFYGIQNTLNKTGTFQPTDTGNFGARLS